MEITSNSYLLPLLSAVVDMKIIGIFTTDFIDLGIQNVFITLDSFVAGIANGYMNNINIVDTVKYAIAMSTITISTEETIHSDMCNDLVKQYMNEINWTEINY